MTRFERRWCDALLRAVIPGEDGLASVDLAGFWPRFDAAAPLHLRLGLRFATWLLCFAPLLVLRPPLFAQTDPEASLQRVATWPGLADLVEVVKVVACFAHFDAPHVQARVRAA